MKVNTLAKKKVWEVFDRQYKKDLPIPRAIDKYNHNINSVNIGD